MGLALPGLGGRQWIRDGGAVSPVQE